MSANRPKQKEIDRTPDREEQEKEDRKGGQNPSQRREQQRSEDMKDTPNYRDQSGKKKTL